MGEYMKKNKIILLIIILTVFILTSVYIEIYPFGYPAKEIQEGVLRLGDYAVKEDIPNTSIYSYRVKDKFKDKSDVINFLNKYKEIENSDMYSLGFDLGSFKDNDGNVVWEDVYSSIKVENKLWKKIYKLDYKTSHEECNGNSISITKDGYILDYRSSGK